MGLVNLEMDSNHVVEDSPWENCTMGVSYERRQFRRVPFRAQVRVKLSARGVSVTANVLDISLGGIRVLCPEPILMGEEVVLVFPFRNHLGVQAEKVSGHAIHVRMDDDAWVIGLEFDRILNPHSTSLLARAVAKKHAQL
jgi:hypothetical protein